MEFVASFYLFAGRSAPLWLVLMLGLFSCFEIYHLMELWIDAPLPR